MLGALKIILTLLGLVISLGAVYNAIGDKNRAMVANWIANWTHAGLDTAIPLLDALESTLEPLTTAFVTAFESYGGPIFKTIRSPVSALVREEIADATAGLTANGESTPDNAVRMAADAMSDAFGFGLASAGVAAAFEAVFPERLNVLDGLAPMLGKMGGFDEVAAAVRDPLYEAAFGQSLKYHFNSVFKPELPNESDAVEWHSRGLLTDDQLRVVFRYSGLKSEYEQPYVDAAYRPVSAFIMLRVLEAGIVDEAAVKDALKFNGYRDADIAALLTYSKWSEVSTYRSQYLSSVITAAERGVVSFDEVDDALSSMQAPAGANYFVHLTIATRKLEQLADIYRKSVSEAYKYGLITDADYIPHLEAIGIAEADAAAHYAVDSIGKQGRALAAEEREAAAAAKRLEAAAVRAALAEYRIGTIDDAALLAALIAAGMDPALAGFAVAYAAARQQGTQVIVHGKLVDRASAQALREQVAAIEAQTKKKLLTADQALNELAMLEIPGPNRNALVAAWAAQAYKTVLPV